MRLAVAAFVVAAVTALGCAGAPPASSPTPPVPTATSAPIVTASPEPSDEPTTVPSPSVTPRPTPVPTPALFRVVHLAAPIGPIVVADFDNDGNLDIAGVTPQGTVALLHGHGDGTYQPALDLPGGDGPGSISAADLNSDGRLDIVLTHTGVSDLGNGADDVVVLLAKKNGTYEHLVRPAGVNPQTAVVADFDGDGKPDLATANQGDELSIFIGLGNGSFADPVGYPINAPFAFGIATADFNGDGKLDLVTANSLIGRGRSDRTISLVLGAGDGTFAEPRVFDVGVPQPTMPLVGDFNGDGLPDVAFPGGYPTESVSVLLGQGDGMLSASVNFRTGDNPHTGVIADIDGDGRLDIVTGNLGVMGGPVHKGIAVMFGLGDGTFQRGIDLIGNQLGEGIGAAADLDNDGRVDLVVGGNDELVLLFNAGAP